MLWKCSINKALKSTGTTRQKILNYVYLSCANVNFLADILVIFGIRMINKKPSLLTVYHNYHLSECFNFFKVYIAEAESSKQRFQDEREVGRVLLVVLSKI